MSFLTINQLTQLKNILKEENRLELIQNSFNSSFTKTSHFSVGSSLTIMLKENLLEPKERITGIYLLSYLLWFEQQQQANDPLLIKTSPFFFSIAEIFKNSENQKEHFLILIFLNESKIEFIKKTPQEILDLEINQIEEIISKNQQKITEIDLKSLEPLEMKHLTSVSISPSLPFPENNDFVEENLEELLKFQLIPEDLQPPFIQPAPPLLNFSDNEIQWLDFENENPNSLIEFISPFEKPSGVFKKLLDKLRQKELTTKEENQLKSLINQDENSLLGFELSPTILTEIIQKNKNSAFEIIQKLIQSPKKNECLNYLEAINISPKIIEFFQEITTKLFKKIPSQFFMKILLKFLEKIKTTKDNSQNKSFIDPFFGFSIILLKNSDFNQQINQQIITELKSFCGENTTNKKSSQLLELLQK